MTGPIPDDLLALFDDYLDGSLDEARLRQLEQRLLSDESARALFVRYSALHTSLCLEARARRAGQRALRRLEQPEPNSGPVAVPPPRRWSPLFRWLSAAAVLLLAAGTGWALARTSNPPAGVAWLVNAQDCQWTDGEAPAGDMKAGTTLRIDRGLAEVRFRTGARILLEGPANVVLLSANSARLAQGQAVVSVPGSPVNFELLSPRGVLSAQGCEFGVAVAADGDTDLAVFSGVVAVRRAGSEPMKAEKGRPVRLEVGGARPLPLEGRKFVKAIVPPPVVVPHTLTLDFRASRPGLLDKEGRGTGLTHRLPGTGSSLLQRDPNLRLDPEKGLLEMTTTESDINRGYKLAGGEYAGLRLADVGFTGAEDFAVTADIPDIPELAFIGQFGLYAGSAADRNIRGGLISKRQPRSYTLFLVNNDGGRDSDSNFVGLHAPGDSLRLTLARKEGKYALTAENLTTGSTSTLTIRHPAFLDGLADLHVGLFAANPRSDVHRPVRVRELRVTVWKRNPAGTAP